MAPNPLLALEKRQKALLAQKKRLEKELADIDKVLEQAKKLAQKYESPVGATHEGGPGGGGGAKPVEVVAAVEEILVDARIPMTRGQLLRALYKRDVIVAGTNPANTLGTTLSRNTNTIANLKGHGYWLRRRSFPAANHPGDPDDKIEQEDGEPSQPALH